MLIVAGRYKLKSIKFYIIILIFLRFEFPASACLRLDAKGFKLDKFLGNLQVRSLLTLFCYELNQA